MGRAGENGVSEKTGLQQQLCWARGAHPGAHHELLTALHLHLSSLPALLHTHSHYFRWLKKLKQSIRKSGAMFDPLRGQPIDLDPDYLGRLRASWCVFGWKIVMCSSSELVHYFKRQISQGTHSGSDTELPRLPLDRRLFQNDVILW